MKKIMFNDEYGLTDAVLQGRKTMTRRIEKGLENLENGVFCFAGMKEIHLYGEGGTIVETIKPQYQLGEIVAISQSYEHIFCVEPSERLTEEFSSRLKGLSETKGWNNKMFVKAELMPHHIRIIGIKVERLQDISDKDVYKEGFRHKFVNNNWGNSAYHEEAILTYNDKLGLTKQIRSREPKEAFSFLIDKISGYGTWENNPWVFVYEIELID